MSEPLRVLMIEDSEEDALLTLRTLIKGGYAPEYHRVQTAEAMTAALQEKVWDIILSDFNMPQFSGFSSITIWKKNNIEIPLIIVSGAIGDETAVDCMRLGASDYIMKDNLSRLVPAIQRELVDADLRRQRTQAKEDLRRQSEELRIQNEELIRFNKVAVDRELRMMELKREINELCKKLGEPPRHKIAEDQE